MPYLGRSGKNEWRDGANLIAGYNTATKEEKEKYDEKKLGRVVGVGILAIAFLLPFAVLTQAIFPAWVAYITNASWSAAINAFYENANDYGLKCFSRDNMSSPTEMVKLVEGYFALNHKGDESETQYPIPVDEKHFK